MKFFDDFIKARSEMIFDCLKSNIIDKSYDIIKVFYEKPKKNYLKNVDVFCDYRKTRVFASFNRETGEILWDGEKYSSVSTAANAIKKKISGKDLSTNGWKFWKYKDGDEEKYIQELRY
ncbi:MAG: hypothetical protein IJH34_00975 [Romboutsia sp.]|nr:hypothetical protein [Romboutsia sp.]